MAKSEKLPIKIMGDTVCPACGKKAKLKRNGGGYLYVYCQGTDDGCGGGPKSTSKKWDIYLAKQCTKWTDPKDRALYLGSTPAPAAAEDPDPDQDEDPAPEPTKKKPHWLDKELF